MKFSNVKDLNNLSSFLRTDYKTMRTFLDNPITILDKKHKYLETKNKEDVSFEDAIVLSDPGDDFYIEEMMIPKKNNCFKFRKVYRILNHNLLFINKVISFHLNREYSPMDCVSGFVAHKNITYNAEKHLNKRVVLNLDVKDFFESITDKMVSDLFIRIGCSEEVSTAIAKLVTVNGMLVQGYSTSPIIANMICENLDNDLLKLASESNSNYSRYADDLCFSSNGNTPDILDIQKILDKYGFNLNSEKTRIMYKGHKQYVTGLTVSDSRYPRIPKRFKRRIRLQLYYMEKFGVIGHLVNIKSLPVEVYEDREKMKFLNDEAIDLLIHLRGWIDYINSVEPDLAAIFYEKLEEIKKSF